MGGFWTPVLLVALSGGCTAGRGVVVALACDEGMVRPLLDVPEAEWPDTLVRGLAMMGRLEGPTSLSLRCPDQADQQITVRVHAPAPAEMRYFSPPEDVPSGSVYSCLDAAAGDGFITIEGVSLEGASLDGGPFLIQDLPFAVAIKRPEAFILVDGFARLQVSGAWQRVSVSYGIDRSEQIYGSILTFRQTVSDGMGHGEGIACQMLVPST